MVVGAVVVVIVVAVVVVAVVVAVVLPCLRDCGSSSLCAWRQQNVCVVGTLRHHIDCRHDQNLKE